MTVPKPYVVPEGHVICLARDVPEGWEYRYGADTRWYRSTGGNRLNPSAIVEARRSGS